MGLFLTASMFQFPYTAQRSQSRPFKHRSRSSAGPPRDRDVAPGRANAARRRRFAV